MARRPYFSGNYGSALGSTANAANLIAQAGAVQGQMFANLGKIAAESINKYTENKQKKEEEKQAASFIENYLKDKPEMAAQFGIKGSDLVSFEEAVKQGSSAIAKNPKGMETVKGLITMEQQRAQAQQTADFNELRADLLRSEQKRVNQQQESQAKFNQFLTQPGPSQVDPSGPDRNSVLRNMRAGNGATPPARMVPGPSAAEQMLASPEAKSFMQRAIQQGAPVQQSMMMASQVDAAKQPKQMTPEELISLKSKILDFELKQNEESRKSTDFSDSESIKTFTPESNYLQLGTTKIPITGRLGSQTEAIKYKDEYIPNFNTTNETFEGLLALGQKRADGWYMESQEKDQAMSYVRQLQGLIREDILGPGTVQESERNILDNIVKNPTSWSINGAEENMKIIRNLRQKIFNRLENRMKNFNLKLEDSNLTNASKDQPDYTDETSSGNRIRTFDFDNLNQ